MNTTKAESILFNPLEDLPLPEANLTREATMQTTSDVVEGVVCILDFVCSIFSWL